MSKKSVSKKKELTPDEVNVDNEAFSAPLPEIVTKEGVRLSKFVTSPEGVITHVKD